MHHIQILLCHFWVSVTLIPFPNFFTYRPVISLTQITQTSVADFKVRFTFDSKVQIASNYYMKMVQ